ncbi:hypothetical protein Pcinc_026039 [Petrolisthes cinctipes]|uniref:Uncharacterized protein n=1 Tax=Petrolisthes cinctipes TaxID=88211 RepID=A0AAE1KAZ6_PETCI|nr:hypothetical protein Pcinc_026039 [Petrolisthes cinctipes]
MHPAAVLSRGWPLPVALTDLSPTCSWCSRRRRTLLQPYLSPAYSSPAVPSYLPRGARLPATSTLATSPSPALECTNTTERTY